MAVMTAIAFSLAEVPATNTHSGRKKPRRRQLHGLVVIAAELLADRMTQRHSLWSLTNVCYAGANHLQIGRIFMHIFVRIICSVFRTKPMIVTCAVNNLTRNGNALIT